MYRVIKTDGTELGLTESPRYIKTDKNTGTYVEAKKEEAVGIAFKGEPYNLFGHNEIEGAATVIVSRADSGDIIVEQRDVSSIVFVSLAEAGNIDDTTATEHRSSFESWVPNKAYVVGQIREYNGNLYRCIQAHTSQADWDPEKVPALWKKIGDPSEEWPEWSRPIGAHDAYEKGAKVTYNGEHWTSTVDANVWTPGEYGWQKEEAAT